MNKKYDVIVIGSGPSGLTAAYKAASSGKMVAVFERNDEPGKKIYATGNGRCNFANEKSEHLDMILAYADEIGLAHVKEEGRFYPRSLQAKDAAKAFISAAKRFGAEIICGCRIVDVQKREQGFEIQSEKGDSFLCEKLVLACGGKAAIQMGCTGDGYKWSEKRGLKVLKPIPALTGLVPSQDISALHGVRVGGRVGIAENGRIIASDEGEIQFTKNGISGICVMNLSRFFRTAEGRKFSLSIDLFPEYETEELKQLMDRQLKTLGSAMGCLAPEKIYEYIRSLSNPCELSIEKVAAFSKSLSFNIESSRGWKDAQVSCGGVELSQLTEDFEVKPLPGLFVIGELSDYDGPCGGFNIAYAIYSGLMAGTKASI